MRKFTLTVGLVLASLFVFSQDVLTPELLWKMNRVGAPVMSPDQTSFIYSVRSYKLEENKGSNVLYIQSMKDQSRKRLTNLEGIKGNVQWLNTETILFSHKGQIYSVKKDGSDLKQISHFTSGMNAFKVSPDGQHILYTSDVKLDQSVNELYKDLPMADARIIDDLMYRHWDNWHDYAYSHIFYTVLNDSVVEGKDIMEGEKFDAPMKPFGGISSITWSNDAKSIAYTCKKVSGKEYAESTNSEIYVYDLTSGKTINISEGNLGYDKHPTYSSDGKYIAWESMETPGYEADKNRIILYNRVTKEKKDLTEGWDQNAHGITWSNDSKYLYYGSGFQATEHIYRMDVASRKIEKLTDGDYDYRSFAIGKKSLIAVRQDMNRPNELYQVDLKKKTVAAVTDENAEIYSKIKSSKVEKRWVKTSDDKEMLVWVIYPPNFDPNKKYPALLYCQGGPQSAVSQFFSFRWNFQLMAANDYIVVAPNRRGLPSFGQEWNHEISKDWGGQSMRDYLAAIDDVSKESFVDETKLGAVGASYGGYSVYYLAGNHEKRFDAFISHCGLYNLESWYGTTEELFFANYDNKGPYWKKENEEYYKKNSPHNYVHNWDAPMLVIHGEKDFRVPIGEGLQAFQAAQIQDIPSRFLYFPEENHWVLQPQNGVLWHRVFFDWLDKWLKN